MRTNFNFTLMLSLTLSMLISTSYASGSNNAVCQEKGDKIWCGQGTVDHVDYLDDLVFNGTTIIGNTKVIGDVDASHTHFNTVDITGDFKGDNSDIKGSAKIVGDFKFDHVVFHQDTSITGDMRAQDAHLLGRSKIVGDITCESCQFSNNLTLSSFTADMANCKISNIDFTPTTKQQTLYLKNSIVNGNITFSSNHGTVYLSEGSTISGAVKGGIVINQ